jgi:hypothetical protein
MIMKQLMKLVFPIAVLSACLAPSIGLAGLVGDPAPALNVFQWVKGGPVEIKPGTNIYVLEIWETRATNGPTITLLNNLQRRFQTNGVVVLGVSDESVGKIQAFVEHGEGTNMEYAVAADNQRHTSLLYMKPVGQRVIPYVFVVGTNGDLLWHGFPQRRLSEVLEAIVSGQYDEAGAKKADLAFRQLNEYVGLARQGGDRAAMAGQGLLAARTNDMPLLCDMALAIATVPRLVTRDFALANEALDQAAKLAPTNSYVIGRDRAILLYESGKKNEGLAQARQMIAFAQTPLDKDDIQACIRSMEKRLKPVKSSPSNASQGNAAGTDGQAPVANASQTNGTDGKP